MHFALVQPYFDRKWPLYVVTAVTVDLFREQVSTYLFIWCKGSWVPYWDSNWADYRRKPPPYCRLYLAGVAVCYRRFSPSTVSARSALILRPSPVVRSVLFLSWHPIVSWHFLSSLWNFYISLTPACLRSTIRCFWEGRIQQPILCACVSLLLFSCVL